MRLVLDGAHMGRASDGERWAQDRLGAWCPAWVLVKAFRLAVGSRAEWEAQADLVDWDALFAHWEAQDRAAASG